MKRLILFVLLLPLLTACTVDAGTQEAPTIAGPALVMFYTDNWVPWEEMMPIVNGLEDEFGNEISVVRLNATDSESAALQSQYGLRGHPSFVVLDASGNVIEHFFGPQSTETLRMAIEQALEPSPY